MIPATVQQLLKTDSAEDAQSLLADTTAAFAVDWREEDDAIVRYCEEILRTGKLSAEIGETDEDPGFEMYIMYGSNLAKVPLVAGPEDRHITLHTLNQLLKPDFDIRACMASRGSDTLVFVPLPAADWESLEKQYGERVEKHFRRISERPNLFIDSW